MTSHFSSIGIDIETEEEFIEIAQRVADEADEVVVGDARYFRWHCPSGAELWLQIDSNDDFIGMNPHFDGTASLFANITERVEREVDTEMDGAFYAWASPDDESPDGMYPFVFDCPDYLVHSGLSVPSLCEVRVAAFAHEIAHFPDSEAYYASQSEEGPKFGEQFFIPAGLFSPEGGQTAPPQAIALFAGIVQVATELTNRLTGKPYYALNVETFGGTYTVVVDPPMLSELPRACSIVSGSFWLSGRVWPRSI